MGLEQTRPTVNSKTILNSIERALDFNLPPKLPSKKDFKQRNNATLNEHFSEHNSSYVNDSSILDSLTFPNDSNDYEGINNYFEY